MVGAKRCPPNTKDCNDGCLSTGNFNGTQQGKNSIPNDAKKRRKFFDLYKLLNCNGYFGTLDLYRLIILGNK